MLSLNLNESSLLGYNSLGTAIGEMVPPPAPVCFVKGTLIQTSIGSVPVERLKEGDVVVTCGGEHVPVRWLGWRHLDLRAQQHRRALPIRIRAGALAHGVPYADLFVSPEHALLLNGVLIPAIKLLNGKTIVQDARDSVTYFHVECHKHVVLVANGAAAESYLCTGSRSFFENAPVAALDPIPLLGPNDFERLRAQLAAPWCTTREQFVAIRQQINARAIAFQGARPARRGRAA
jgi:hypothetical protein